MIRWFINIGSIDIKFEVSDLSRYLAFSKTGHLVQDLHVFKYLEIHNVNDLDFNICYQRVISDKNIQSKGQLMKDFYVDTGEEIPPNISKTIGKPV